MKIEDQQLKAFLLDSGSINKKQLKEAEIIAEKLKKKLSDILLDQKMINEEELIRLQAYILGIPFVDLAKENVSLDILKIIPELIARKHNIVAFRKKGSDLEVAMTDPDDIQTIEFIRKKSNLNILPRLTDSKSIKEVLNQYKKSIEEELGGLIATDTKDSKFESEFKEEGSLTGDIKKNSNDNTNDNTNDNIEDLEKVAEDLPVIKIVDTILHHAINQNASDIHIEPTEKDVMVRYRIDGLLHEAMVLPKKLQQGVVARIKVLSNLKLDEHRLPQDGRFKVELDDYKISFRVSLLPVFDGEKIVMRLLKETTTKYSLELLGIKGEALARIQRAIKKPTGMLLVTGPTGSGKTSTLYTAMDILNTQEVNISTIEDPIEYRMPRINQTQVKSTIGMTFAAGLRALLRQDPNIIMVGEIRDNETASLAVNAALTGHLVLSTLHTNSAAGALPRLVDMGIEPFLISSTVNAILAQRLVRRLCDSKESYLLSDDQIKSLSEQFDLNKILNLLIKEKAVDQKSTWKTIKFYKAKPSKDCPSGYKGRIGIYEALEITEAIREMIIKGSASDEVERLSKENGMITMLEDGFMKAVLGETSIEEILRVTKE
ncbi:MAG: ATPase, T2SS/T4P/T4SS family [Patescibacteria group bacterium]